MLSSHSGMIYRSLDRDNHRPEISLKVFAATSTAPDHMFEELLARLIVNDRDPHVLLHA